MSLFGFEFPIHKWREEQESAQHGTPQQTARHLGSLAGGGHQKMGHSKPPRAAYVVANQDWPAVPGLSPDDEAYNAILATYSRVTEDQYNQAMEQLSQTELPAPSEDRGTPAS